MSYILIRWAINALALVVVCHIVPGIEASNLTVILVAAIVLGIINAFLKPLLILVTLPINILSLGLFTLFINGFLLFLVSKIVKGFVIAGFWPAFFGALIFSLVSFFAGSLVSENGKIIIRIEK